MNTDRYLTFHSILRNFRMSDEEPEDDDERDGPDLFLSMLRRLLSSRLEDNEDYSDPNEEPRPPRSGRRRRRSSSDSEGDNRSQEDIDIERAIALSLQEQDAHGREQDEQEAEIQRLIEASERESRETEAIRAFIADPRALRSVLSELKDVDPNDPCFGPYLPR
jgi:hypothetical protein